MRIIRTSQKEKISILDYNRIAMEMVNIYTGVEHYDIQNIKKISNPTNTKYLNVTHPKNGTQYEYIPSIGYLKFNFKISYSYRDKIINILKQKFKIYVRGFERETVFRYHLEGTSQYTLEEIEEKYVSDEVEFFDIRTTNPNKRTNLTNLHFLWILSITSPMSDYLYEYSGVIQNKESMIESMSCIYIDGAFNPIEEVLTINFPRAVGKLILPNKINVVDHLFYFHVNSNMGFDYTLRNEENINYRTFRYFEKDFNVYSFKEEEHPLLKYYETLFDIEDNKKKPITGAKLMKCIICNKTLTQDHYIMILKKDKTRGVKYCSICTHTQNIKYENMNVFRGFNSTYKSKQDLISELPSDNVKSLFKTLDSCKTTLNILNDTSKLEPYIKHDFIKHIKLELFMIINNSTIGFDINKWGNLLKYLHIFNDGITIFSYKLIYTIGSMD